MSVAEQRPMEASEAPVTPPTPEERARTAREIVERFLDSHGWEVVGYGPRWGQDPRDAAAELAHAIAAALAARDEELAQLRGTLAAIEEDGTEEHTAAVKLRQALAEERRLRAEAEEREASLRMALAWHLHGDGLAVRAAEPPEAGG